MMVTISRVNMKSRGFSQLTHLGDVNVVRPQSIPVISTRCSPSPILCCDEEPNNNYLPPARKEPLR